MSSHEGMSSDELGEPEQGCFVLLDEEIVL